MRLFLAIALGIAFGVALIPSARQVLALAGRAGRALARVRISRRTAQRFAALIAVLVATLGIGAVLEARQRAIRLRAALPYAIPPIANSHGFDTITAAGPLPRILSPEAFDSVMSVARARADSGRLVRELYRRAELR